MPKINIGKVFGFVVNHIDEAVKGAEIVGRLIKGGDRKAAVIDGFDLAVQSAKDLGDAERYLALLPEGKKLVEKLAAARVSVIDAQQELFAFYNKAKASVGK